MKSVKKLGFFVWGMTTVFVGISAIAITYTPKAQAAGLVKNGGFEIDPLLDPNKPTPINNPYITGWVNDSDAIGDGTYGFRVSNYPNTGNRNLSLSGPGYLSQTLNTVVGQQYQLSHNLASIDSSDPGLPFLSNIFRTYIDNKVIDEKVDLTNQQFHTENTLYKYNFVATSPNTELKFFAYDYHDFLYLDDVSVKPVPEPLTLSGTAVAGLLGIWLKKKQLASNIKSNL